MAIITNSAKERANVRKSESKKRWQKTKIKWRLKCPEKEKRNNDKIGKKHTKQFAQNCSPAFRIIMQRWTRDTTVFWCDTHICDGWANTGHLNVLQPVWDTRSYKRNKQKTFIWVQYVHAQSGAEQRRAEKQLQNGDNRKRQLSESLFGGWLRTKHSCCIHTFAFVHAALLLLFACATDLFSCRSLCALYIICNYAALLRLWLCWCQCHTGKKRRLNMSVLCSSSLRQLNDLNSRWIPTQILFEQNIVWLVHSSVGFNRSIEMRSGKKRRDTAALCLHSFHRLKHIAHILLALPPNLWH